jgi:uncharacterized protein (TIGR02246 family)
MPARSAEECDRLFAEHLNAGDLDGLIALYETTGSLVQQDGSVASGHVALREALGGFLAMQPKIRMNVVQVVKSGDELAVLYNDWSTAVVGPDGQAMQMAGKAIEVVRRQPDGTWLFAVDAPFARG